MGKSLTLKDAALGRHGDFGGTGFLFSDCLGSRATTEKKSIVNYELHLRAVYSCFHKNYIVSSPLESGVGSCRSSPFSAALQF